MSILDITVVDSDTLSLQNALHAWLHDCSTDQEHLHLILPPLSTTALGQESRSKILIFKFELPFHSSNQLLGDRESTSIWEDSATGADVTHHKEVKIKCDFQERVLDPSACFDTKLGDPFVSKLSSLGLDLNSNVLVADTFFKYLIC